MDDPTIQALLEDLKSSDPVVRSQATEELWRTWFNQKGPRGLDLITQSQVLLNRGDWREAETVLTKLLLDDPDFAEAWNRRAVLYYSQQRFAAAVADCQTVLKLNPIHFGAWHGLGLCQAALGNYREAIQAFRQAAEIQPYALENQRLILECTALLS